MKINWKLRLKNKATLAGIAGCTVAAGYQVCGYLGITPMISENEVTQYVASVLTILTAIGVIADPTTKGVSDSKKALEYKEPK